MIVMRISKPRRSDPSPMFRQIAWELERQIAQGELPPGRKLPDERHLAQRFGVSRVTIRKALGILEQDGLIIRSRAKGTFVAGPESWPQAHASPGGAPVPIVGIMLRDIETHGATMLERAHERVVAIAREHRPNVPETRQQALRRRAQQLEMELSARVSA